jgi:hypothetical protein
MFAYLSFILLFGYLSFVLLFGYLSFVLMFGYLFLVIMSPFRLYRIAFRLASIKVTSKNSFFHLLPNPLRPLSMLHNPKPSPECL